MEFDNLAKQNVLCFASTEESRWLWDHRLGHASMKLIRNLSHDEHVYGLPKLKFEKDYLCNPCQIRKQIKGSFKLNSVISTSRPPQLLHRDLFSPTETTRLGLKDKHLLL